MAGGEDFDPVAIGVFDEVDAHVGILEADAPHGGVLGVEGIVVLGAEGEVEFLVAEVVGFGAVAEPGEFELEIALMVGEVDNLEGAVFGVDVAALLEAEGLFIEGKALVEVEDIEVEVDETRHVGVPFGMDSVKEAGWRSSRILLVLIAAIRISKRPMYQSRTAANGPRMATIHPPGLLRLPVADQQPPINIKAPKHGTPNTKA